MQFKSTTTIYEQIAGMIEDNILSGLLAANDRLQSVRALASEVQVNPNTVQRTYSILQDAGVVRNKRGIGYFVAEGAQELILKKRRTLFEQEVLPEQFRQLALLGFTPVEIESLYRTYIEEHSAKKAA